ncbi:hypothetical protein BaRGS_00009356 [Batillaria attramentaria]|uniref:Non-structural maintenance of chromosomes element 4 n=1 Tax=Batillaria attramentaria TaxID=370345 RepID=A0ABD0LJL2_9CAEN
MAGTSKRRGAMSQQAENEDEEDIPVETLKEMVHSTRAQPESERRIIRQETYAAIESMIEHRPELINPESDDLTRILDEAEERFQRVQTTREAAIDSHLLAMISDYGRQKAQALNLEFVKFQPLEFAEKLKTFVSHQLGTQERGSLSSVGWRELGKFSQTFLKKSPALHFMCGAFERGEVVKKPVARQAREKRDNEPGKATELKQVESSSEMQKRESTTKEVESVLNTLHRYYEETERCQICYFEFVINPFSFGQTVENIFYVSFLAKDGYIKIFLDSDGLPVIEPVEADERESAGPDTNRARQQMVVAITPKEWREIVKTFDIKEPLIKTRAPVGSKARPGPTMSASSSTSS